KRALAIKRGWPAPVPPPRRLVSVSIPQTRSLRLARGEPLDDAQLGALEPLDDEPRGADTVEGLAREVVVLEAQEERLEQALAEADRQHRTADVLEEHEAPARTQHAHRLGDRRAV